MVGDRVVERTLPVQEVDRVAAHSPDVLVEGLAGARIARGQEEVQEGARSLLFSLARCALRN